MDAENLSIMDEMSEGVVKAIKEPVKIETRFGTSYRIPFVVEVNNKDMEIGVLVRENTMQKGVLHPRSNLYKLLQRYNCKKVKDLVGKKVQLRIDSRGFYRFLI